MKVRFWRNVVIGAIVVSAVVPMIPVLIWCFTSGWYFPDLLPEQWSVRGWIYITEPYSRAIPALINSFLIAGAVTLVSFPIGIPAARALGLYKFRGKRLVEYLILAPLIVPELPVAIGIHILFIKYGLANTLLGRDVDPSHSGRAIRRAGARRGLCELRAGNRRIRAHFGRLANKGIFLYYFTRYLSGHGSGGTFRLYPILANVCLYVDYRRRGRRNPTFGRIQLYRRGRQSHEYGPFHALYRAGHPYAPFHRPLSDRRQGSRRILGNMTSSRDPRLSGHT